MNMSPSHQPFSALVDFLSPERFSAAARVPRLVFIDEDERETDVSLLELRAEASRFAVMLRASGLRRGEVVPLVLPTSKQFVVALFGVLFAGGTPTALALPAGFGDIDNFARRTSTVCDFLHVRRLVTTAGLRDCLSASVPGVDLLVDPELPASADGFVPTPLEPSEAGILQCTSGSTGAPKAVVLTHANLIANCRQIATGLSLEESDVCVSWLPLNHDMGLIGCLFTSLWRGIDLVLMSPGLFLRRPALWLKAISRHRATISPAPNFAYAYATARAKDTELARLDLSSWRIALCGAEPISARTIDAFQKRFASYGLRANVVVPCYGLAEASLAVTIHTPGTGMTVDRVDRESLVDRGIVSPSDSHDGALRVDIVSCGQPLPGTEVRVVGGDGHVVPECRIGKVMVRGPSIMKEYMHAPDRTAAVLRDGWLDTGDLGYVRDGNLYITGREKDLIIVRGRNFTPTEFEWAAERVAGVRKGNAVAFGAFAPDTGTECLTIVCETDVSDLEEREELKKRITTEVMKQTGIRPDAVHLVGRERLPKTTSGKIQRAKAKRAYIEQRPSHMWRTSSAWQTSQ
jgi:acyl-CoA synthetase (AMP-forming)/AMP-acid ligase II